MSIQDKLTTIAENVPKVYEAGVAEGRQNAYDEFWDIYQDYGNRNDYGNAFGGLSKQQGWDDTTYNPKYPIIIGSTTETGNNYSGYRLYLNSQITSTKVPIIAKGASLSDTFMSPTLKEIVYLEVDENTTFTNLDGGVPKLASVNMVGVIANDIEMVWEGISKENIIQLMGILSDTVTGKTATFAHYAVTRRFATTEGGKDGDTSTEWLELVATKPNWTIALG